MRARAAQEQPSNRRRVARPAGDRTQAEQLVQAQIAVEDVAAGEPIVAFEIERRERVDVLHGAADVWRVLLEQPERTIDECRPRGLVPGRANQAVWRVLGEDRHDVLPVRRERWVVRRRDGDLEQRRP